MTRDKIDETFEWTTTMEYQELNFKREALTINPAKACQPLGAVLCALGFEKTLPYVHGSQGCVAYFRTYFNRHFKEPIACVSDSMTEDAAVFGGQKNMYRRPGKRQGAVQAGNDRGLHHLHGRSDRRRPERLHQQHQEGRPYSRGLPGSLRPYPVLRRFATSPAGTTCSKASLRYFTLNNMEGKVVGSNGKINIVPGFETYLGNYRVIKRMLDEMGVAYTMLSDPTEVLDTPADGTVPHVRRRHHAGRGEGCAERHQHLPAAAAATRQDQEVRRRHLES